MRPIVICGVYYKSIVEASTTLGISRFGIFKRLQKGQYRGSLDMPILDRPIKKHIEYKDWSNVAGQTFGKLTVIKKYKGKMGFTTKVRVRCHCEHYLCKKEFDCQLCHVVNGKKISCGRQGLNQHGWSQHPVYKTWNNIMNRCVYCAVDKPSYNGMEVYEEWHKPAPFCEWAVANGWFEHCHIHREDNNKGYLPTNVVFITEEEHWRIHPKWQKHTTGI